MGGYSWLLFGVCAVAALALVVYVYRARETPVRGRGLLGVLRWSALALLILLAFDPDLPTAGAVVGGRGRQVLLDASLSMSLAADTGESTRWQSAARQARGLANGRPVILFGAATVTVSPDSLESRRPDAAHSRLLPALQAASEAGVGRVVVLTDGGIEDAAEVARWLPRLGLDVEYRIVRGDSVSDRSLDEVDAPPWAESGKPATIGFGVAATGAAGDSVTVSLRHGAEVLGTRRVVVPAAGRVSSGSITFIPEAPRGGGPVRYDLALEAGDAVAADDRRSVYIHVSDEPAGVALVSFQPDWEPRFLEPVLQQALGVPVRGFLQVTGPTYIGSGAGGEAGQRASEQQVRRAIAGADLVVLHAIGSDAPAWAVEALRTARRLLVFPATDAGALPLPVELGRPVQDEWYASADVPASPIAELLTDLSAEDTPPLLSLRSASAPEGTFVPMNATRGRRGAAMPLAIAGRTDGRRWAIALGNGYWRWAFRGGDSRQIYDRLWSALAGWLVQEPSVANGPTVRPASPVLPRGEPGDWVAAGLAPDSIGIRLTGADGAAVLDTIVPATRDDTAAAGALPPGTYRYQSRAFAGDSVAATGAGEVTVESYTPEFTRAAVELGALEAAAVPVGPSASRRSSRPLHAAPWPYVAILLLLAAEWVLRRRWGLR